MADHDTPITRTEQRAKLKELGIGLRSPNTPADDLLRDLERLTADDLAEAQRILNIAVPPTDELERSVLRQRLMQTLKGMGVSACAGIADAWLNRKSSATWREPETPPPVKRVDMPQLALEPDLLGRFSKEVETAGLAHERTTSRLLFLAMVSRVLARPVNVVVKGPSSGGKNFTVEQVLAFFPAWTHWIRTAVSPKAMAYSTESFVNRFVVLLEAESIQSEEAGTAALLIRSLLSEGHIKYETVIDGAAVTLDKPGPTGLITTTTATALHPENETRMFSVTVDDSPEQTRAVLMALAEEDRSKHDYSGWHQLSTWLEQQDNLVTIPYAMDLAKRANTRAVRMRRDFGAILTLVRSHAVLHQATREREDDGRIIATVADYNAVRDLVGELAAVGAGLTVPATIRATVEVVASLVPVRDVYAGHEGASAKAVSDALNLHKTAAWRRLQDAVAQGYVRNLETVRGQPGRYVIGDPMPEGTDAVPELGEPWE